MGLKPDIQIFLVGGAVRDALMGLPMADRDWVVVGASPSDMLELGFKPVGKDFPVFLHPQTKEEFALARTERKTAPGYQGFAFHAAPDVTLAQDLSRRDLTINAMAVRAVHRVQDQVLHCDVPADPAQWLRQGLLSDPFDGQTDLQQQVLRHIGPAFEEDPVRILRLARLAARFKDFKPTPDTMALMRRMVDSGEVHHLVAERVWQELSRGLMQAHPEAMLDILHACGALQILLPELDRLHGVPQSAQHHPEIDAWAHMRLVMQLCARLDTELPVRVACLFHDLGKGTTPPSQWPRHIGHEQRSVQLLLSVCERLRVPTDCKDLAFVMAREHGHIHRCQSLGAAAALRLLERCDAFRQPQRFRQLLKACECDARGRQGFETQRYTPGEHLAQIWQTASAVPTQQLSAQAVAEGLSGPAIGQRIAEARTAAIAALLPSLGNPS